MSTARVIQLGESGGEHRDRLLHVAKVPFLVHRLGDNLYGIWTLVVARVFQPDARNRDGRTAAT